MIGRTVTHYSVLRKLGEGGMGEVYLAEDTTLDRQVAIKVLSSERAEDAHGIKRLMREAKAAATLDHPNICAIHEVGEADGRHFIVMQYVEGETLAARLAGERLALKDALAIAIQVTDALALAHARGIVHRDIKPQNIMITPHGQAKLMDFGLAIRAPDASPMAGDAVTESMLTTPGAILGTVKYMSPEQVQGQPLDARSDIFSFGVVLYEMASGRHPFAGDNRAATISAIILGAPEPVAQVVPETPAELDRILTKALAKNPAERYQSIQELLVDLQALARDLESDARPRRTTVSARGAPGRRQWSPYPIAAAAVVLAAAVGLSWYLSSPRSTGPSPKDATFMQLTDLPGQETEPSLAPDGRSFAYASLASGNWDIYLQRVGGTTVINLTKDSPAIDRQPAFSPNGEQIAFRSGRDGGGIFIMGATGESVWKLTEGGYHPAWSPDGTAIVYATLGFRDPDYRYGLASRLFVIDISTRKTRPLSSEKVDAVQPRWSPHGLRIAYWSRRDIWTVLAGLDQADAPVRVTDDEGLDWGPAWSADGRHLYFSSDRGGSTNVWRIPLDESSGKLLGPAEAVTTPSTYSGHISVSSDGQRVAYAKRERTSNIYKVGFDPSTEAVVGLPVPVTQGSREFWMAQLSPDEDWLAIVTRAKDDLFLIRPDGSGLRQLTRGGTDRAPMWSPDRRRIAFMRRIDPTSTIREIWVIDKDGSGPEQLTYTNGDIGTAPVWSPDGGRLAYVTKNRSTFIMDVGTPWTAQSVRPIPAMTSPIGTFAGRSWSPDGRRIVGERRDQEGEPAGIFAYSLESGTFERLTDFGVWPRWMPDGRRVLFCEEGKLFLVDSISRKAHEILSVSPREVYDYQPAVTRSQRLLYFTVVAPEVDVWLMNLK